MRRWNRYLWSRGPSSKARLIVTRVLLTGALGTFLPPLVEGQPTTTRASVASGGSEAKRPSLNPAINADGRWVAFDSTASNLVTDDTKTRSQRHR